MIKVNQPDLVLFVGEALVGNEAVDQLVKFNQALADNSNQEQPHLIDGIVLTKGVFRNRRSTVRWKIHPRASDAATEAGMVSSSVDQAPESPKAWRPALMARTGS